MINKESKDNNLKITIDASINLQTEDIREIKESSNVLLSNRNVEKRVVTKRKRVQVSQPAIATLFPLYSIDDDLRNYKMDITIKQLIKMMPRIGNELIKGMHNPTIKTKTKEAHLAGADDSENNSELITSYCNTSIKNIQFPLIIDFGSTMVKINSYNAMIENDWLRKTKMPHFRMLVENQLEVEDDDKKDDKIKESEKECKK